MQRLDLQSNDGDSCFTVKPEELLLRTGEEQGVVVTFTPRSNKKFKEWFVTVSFLHYKAHPKASNFLKS